MHPDLTEKNFLKKTGAKDGYAKKMFTEMYQSIISERIDVIAEYKKFYSVEYGTLEEYLYKKYNLEVESIEELMEALEENKECRLYRKDQNSYGNWEISTFMNSETMFDRITEILLTK
ncbi:MULTISPECIES: hypothetical protein [Bacteroidota]|nr:MULTISPECIES: hypothetical protein [Chryseobacterium]QQY31749.1 hypothetical protein I6I60_23365 [Chryseobacterium gleum]